MRRLYYSIVLLIIWLSLIFNLERIVAAFPLSSFLYWFLPLCSVLIISVLRWQKVSSSWIFAVVLSAYGLLRYQLVYPISRVDLALVVNEVTAIAVTLFISIFIGQRLQDLRTTLAGLVIGQIDEEVKPFERGQGLLYREVRRARKHHRPLALLAVSAPASPFQSVVEPAINGAFPSHVVAEFQRELGYKYVLTRIGSLLLEKLEDSAIVTQLKHHFVVLVPETSSDELPSKLQSLQAAAEERLGYKLNIGSATFPDQEITFEALLERAEIAMLESTMSRIPQVASNDSKITSHEFVHADNNNGSPA